jgi:hypothetical protein
LLQNQYQRTNNGKLLQNVLNHEKSLKAVVLFGIKAQVQLHNSGSGVFGGYLDNRHCGAFNYFDGALVWIQRKLLV